MARLSKQQSKLQEQVLGLVHSDSPLTFEQKEFILQNYQGDGIGSYKGSEFEYKVINHGAFLADYGV